MLLLLLLLHAATAECTLLMLLLLLLWSLILFAAELMLLKCFRVHAAKMLQSECCYCRGYAATAEWMLLMLFMLLLLLLWSLILFLLPTTVNTAILQLRPKKNNNNFNLLLTGYMEAGKKNLATAFHALFSAWNPLNYINLPQFSKYSRHKWFYFQTSRLQVIILLGYLKTKLSKWGWYRTW